MENSIKKRLRAEREIERKGREIERERMRKRQETERKGDRETGA